MCVCENKNYLRATLNYLWMVRYRLLRNVLFEEDGGAVPEPIVNAGAAGFGAVGKGNAVVVADVVVGFSFRGVVVVVVVVVVVGAGGGNAAAASAAFFLSTSAASAAFFAASACLAASALFAASNFSFSSLALCASSSFTSSG